MTTENPTDKRKMRKIRNVRWENNRDYAHGLFRNGSNEYQSNFKNFQRKLSLNSTESKDLCRPENVGIYFMNQNVLITDNSEKYRKVRLRKINKNTNSSQKSCEISQLNEVDLLPFRPQSDRFLNTSMYNKMYQRSIKSGSFKFMTPLKSNLNHEKKMELFKKLNPIIIGQIRKLPREYSLNKSKLYQENEERMKFEMTENGGGDQNNNDVYEAITRMGNHRDPNVNTKAISRRILDFHSNKSPIYKPTSKCTARITFERSDKIYESDSNEDSLSKTITLKKKLKLKKKKIVSTKDGCSQQKKIGSNLKNESDNPNRLNELVERVRELTEKLDHIQKSPLKQITLLEAEPKSVDQCQASALALDFPDEAEAIVATSSTTDSSQLPCPSRSKKPRHYKISKQESYHQLASQSNITQDNVGYAMFLHHNMVKPIFSQPIPNLELPQEPQICKIESTNYFTNSMPLLFLELYPKVSELIRPLITISVSIYTQIQIQNILLLNQPHLFTLFNLPIHFIKLMKTVESIGQQKSVITKVKTSFPYLNELNDEQVKVWSHPNINEPSTLYWNLPFEDSWDEISKTDRHTSSSKNTEATKDYYEEDVEAFGTSEEMCGSDLENDSMDIKSVGLEQNGDDVVSSIYLHDIVDKELEQYIPCREEDEPCLLMTAVRNDNNEVEKVYNPPCFTDEYEVNILHRVVLQSRGHSESKSAYITVEKHGLVSIAISWETNWIYSMARLNNPSGFFINLNQRRRPIRFKSKLIIYNNTECNQIARTSCTLICEKFSLNQIASPFFDTLLCWQNLPILNGSIHFDTDNFNVAQCTTLDPSHIRQALSVPSTNVMPYYTTREDSTTSNWDLINDNDSDNETGVISWSNSNSQSWQGNEYDMEDSLSTTLKLSDDSDNVDITEPLYDSSTPKDASFLQLLMTQPDNIDDKSTSSIRSY